MQSLRAMFGLGRPAKAKAVPFFVIAVTMLPAMAMLAASSASSGQVAVKYAQVVAPQLLLFVLFLAAQAPEVLSRDQQHKLLPLLFTRDVSRTSYALARVTAIFTAVFLVALGPTLLLYVGEIGIAKDPAATMRLMGNRIGPVLAQATLSAFAMSGIGAALASLTPRRAYATAAVFGTFLLLTAISSGLDDLAGMNAAAAESLDPIRTMQTMAMLFFGETTRGMELNPPAPIGTYIALTTAWGALGCALLLWRVRRIRP
jgi:ABC-2 type transport system permease protein